MRFLQERIRQVQQGFEEWEDKTRREMEQCARYLDSLSSDDVIKYDPNWLRESIKTPTHDKPWEQVGYHLTIYYATHMFVSVSLYIYHNYLYRVIRLCLLYNAHVGLYIFVILSADDVHTVRRHTRT